MTEQEVKELFHKLRCAKVALSAADEALTHIRTVIQSVNAPPLSDLPRIRSSSMESSYERLDAAIDKYEHYLNVYSDLCDRATALLEFADDMIGKNIIIRRWFIGESWSRIRKMMYISERTMFRHYKTAIREISQKTKYGSE